MSGESKVDDTRGWFFVFTRTTKSDGTTTSELRGGGKPAMILAIGCVLVAAYAVYMMVPSPSPWASVFGFLVVVVAFIGMFVYFTERERQPSQMSVNAEDDE